LRNRKPAFPESFRKFRIPPDTPVYLVLAGLVLGIYGQTLYHGFIDLDDGTYLFDNPFLRDGLTLSSLRWAFGTFRAANWHPVTWISHLLDVSLFGFDPAGHHLGNVILHLTSSAILFRFLRRATGSRRESALVAALFAVHPLHVESVAWIAERKDLLSALFFLLALDAYVTYCNRPAWPRYLAVFLLLCLALMAKPMAVTLPFVMLLLDWWPLDRFAAGPEAASAEGNGTRGTVRAAGLVAEKIPLLAPVAASCLLTLMAQSAANAVSDIPFGWRAANAAYSYAWYALKTFWPSSLSFYYPHPYLSGPGSLTAWGVAGAALLLGAVSLMAARFFRRRPWVAAGWLFFLGTLLPVIGVIQVGGQGMADRYTYIPLIGIFTALAWSVPEVGSRLLLPKGALAVVVAVALAALSVCAWVTAGYWKDSFSVAGRALETTRNNWVACNTLGVAEARAGRLDKAIPLFRRALEFLPSFENARTNLKTALAEAGRRDAESPDREKESPMRPGAGEAAARIDRCVALMTAGKTEEALEQARLLVGSYPGLAEGRNLLGAILTSKGDFAGAVMQLEEAVRLREDFAEARTNLSIALRKTGRMREAEVQAREAVRLRPEVADARFNLALALEYNGKTEEAIDQYREALAIAPGDRNSAARLERLLSAKR
jgi:tetratricopeptide (TPR) repeat protein